MKIISLNPKKYKLIKTYPGYQELGYITAPITNDEMIKIYSHTEFWQEVIDTPKEYEILSFSYITIHNTENIWELQPDGTYNWNNRGPLDLKYLLNISRQYKIHSVKRLSDGEIFNIGDNVLSKNLYDSYGIIKSFHINDTNEVYIKYENNHNQPNLKHLVKAKQPLFKTEDGVDIFEGDQYFHIQNFTIVPNVAYSWERSGKNNYSTKQAAENYIICNKPCLSLTDVLDTYASVANRDSPLYNRLKGALKSLIKTKL